MPDPIIKYQIYNKEGKSAFVDGALFDKNVNGFAEKYKDATIRMVDPNGNSRNVPISMYEEAKRRGGRAYTANFVKKQNAVQTEPTQQEAPAASPQSPVQQSAQQPAVQPVNTAPVAQPAPQQEVVQPVDSPAVAQPVSIDSANAQRVDTASRMAPAVQAPSIQAPTVGSQKEFVGPLHSNQPFGTVSGRNAIAEAQKNMDVRKIIREGAEKGFEGFYQKNVAGSFQSEKAAAEERSRSKTIEPTLQSVYSPFQNWSVNTRNAVVEAHETNPEKVANTVLNHIDESALSDYVLRRMGIDPSMSQEEQTEVSQGDSAKIKDATAEMRDKVLGELQQRMYDEYKAAKAPKSVLEYIISSAMKNNLSTKLLTAIINRAAGNKGVLQQLEGQALQEFGEKQSVFARGAAAAGSIMMDAPWFKGVGMVGNAARAGITNLFTGGGKMVMNAIGNRSLGTIADVAAKRWASMNPFVNVAAGSIGSGITFGLYDTAGEAINEFQNGELSLNGLASAFGHGFFTGSAVGMLGGTISAATRNASKAKKLVADVGGFAGETALFTGLEGYEQMKEKHIGVADVDWASIAGKNAAMLGVLKLQSIPQIRERYKSTGDILTKDDKEALKAQGIDPEKWFGLDMLSKLSEERNYSLQRYGQQAKDAGLDNGAFREFLANENIPINTRRRVSYLMCGVATPEPRAYGMESGQDENGFFVNTYTDNGKLIERKTFKSQSDFNNAFENVSGQVQLNTIDALRAMSRNKSSFFNESLLSVADEAGIELTEISEAVRRVRDGKATQTDRKIVERVNELMEQKANANGDDVENRAANAVLNSTGIDVAKALAKKNSQRTPLEKQAISEYAQRLQEELGLNGENTAENAQSNEENASNGAENAENFTETGTRTEENVQNPAESAPEGADNVQNFGENVQNQPEGSVEPTPGGSSDPELTLRERAKAEYLSGNREGVRDTALRYRLSKDNLAAAGYTGDYSDLDEIASDPTTPPELKQAAIEYMDAHDAIGGYMDAIDEQVAQNVEKYKASMEPLVDQNTGMITFGTDTTGKRVYVTSSRSRAGMVWVTDENGENRRMMYLKDIKDMAARDPEEIYAEFQQQAEQQAKAELDGITSASMNVGDKVSLSLDDPESIGTIVAVNPDGTMLVKDNLGRTVPATREQLADIQDKVGMRDILQKEQFKQERQQRQDSIEETLKGVGIVPGKPITLAQEEEGGTFSPYKAVVDGFENGMVKMHLFGEGPMYFFQMEPEELMSQFNKNNELEEAERVQAEETRKAEERARAEAEAADEAQREAERQAELQKVAKNRLAKTDDGKPDFERSKPEDVAAYIREEIGLDNADRTIANTMAPIQMEIQDFEDAIKNGKLGIAEAADASTRLKWAKERLDFWNNVRGLVDGMKSQEKAVDLTKEKKVAPKEKEYKPLEDAKVQYSDVPEAIEALGDLQPRTLEEVAAEMLWSGEVKLLQNDDTSTGHTIKGYKSHTGFSQGEAASMLRYSATRENGGIGIEHFGELVQDRANALGVQYDKSDANVGLDAVVNLLSGISRENPIANYIANQRIAEAKTIADAYYQQRENDCWNQYGMGYYEYEAMQEAIWDYADKVKTTIDEAEEFFFSQDADKMAEEKHNAELLNSDYFNTFAEEFKLAQDAYFKDLENEGSNDNDQSRAASSIGNSSEVQQGPRTDGLPGERVEGEEVQSRPESNVVGNINVPESSEVSGENAGELSGESEISPSLNEYVNGGNTVRVYRFGSQTGLLNDGIRAVAVSNNIANIADSSNDWDEFHSKFTKGGSGYSANVAELSAIREAFNLYKEGKISIDQFKNIFLPAVRKVKSGNNPSQQKPASSGRSRKSFKSLLDGVNANPQNEVDSAQEKFEKEKASFANTPGNNEYAKALHESNNVREAVAKIVAPVAEYANGYKDWAGRQYKKNNTAIEVGGKYDDLDATTTSIGSVNERRRNARMAEFRRSAEERMEWVDTLLKRCGIPAEERSNYLPDGFKSFDELIAPSEAKKLSAEDTDKLRKLFEQGPAIQKQIEKERDEVMRHALMELTDEQLQKTIDELSEPAETFEEWLESESKRVEEYLNGNDASMFVLERWAKQAGQDPTYREISLKRAKDELVRRNAKVASNGSSKNLQLGTINAQASTYILGDKKDNEGNNFYEKNGSIDLWDVSKLLEGKREVAPVRLTDRNIGHILNEHKKEFSNDPKKVVDFLDDVFSKATVIRRARGGAMFVVVVNDRTDKAAIIKLMPSEHGDYYNVESAGFYRKDKWKENEEIISELSEPTQSDATTNDSKPQNPQRSGEDLFNAESLSESKDTTLSSENQISNGKTSDVVRLIDELYKLSDAYNVDESISREEYFEKDSELTKKVDELLKDLSDEELDKLYNELHERDDDSDVYLYDELERRESKKELGFVEKQKSDNKNAADKARSQYDAFKEAHVTGDKKAIKKAEEALEKSLLESGVGNHQLRTQIDICKSHKKSSDDYKVQKSFGKVCQKVVDTLQSELNDAIKAAGIDGVTLEWGNGFGFWLSAGKGSKYHDKVNSLDNNERWFLEISERNGALSDCLPQLNRVNIGLYVDEVKNRLEVTDGPEDGPGKKNNTEFPENSFEAQNEDKIDELSGRIGDLDAEIEQLQDKLDGEEDEMFRFNTEMAIESKTKRRNDLQSELDGLQQANDISRQEMKAPKKLEDRPVEAVIANKEKLQDFGEKIGMARKDTAKSGFKRGTSDGIPAWKKKYKVHNADAKALSGVDKWGFSSWMNAQDMVLGEGPDKSKPFIAYTSESKKTPLGNWERHYPVTDDHGKIIVFNSEEEFEATIPVYEAAQQKYKVRKGSDGQFKIVRAASNGKLVEYATFDTEEQAKAYLASPEGATSLLNHKRENYELPALENLTRNNMPDYRKGKDATPEMFLEDFGFRGGEFGNWLNAEERQQFLNLAYDAFMDMAEMLGVSPKAISLGGELSIAFGARGGSVRAGGGSAAAHYEPGRAVINLTKMHGAGSVAHEWAHALDNYFGLQGQGIARDRNNFDNTDVYSTTSYGGYKLRPEVREAFMNVVNTMTRKRVTRKVEADAQSEAYTKLQKNFNYAVEKSAKAELDTKRTSRKYNRKTKEYEYTEHTLTDEQKAKALELINKLPDDPTFKFTYSFAKNGFRASGDVAEELYELIADILPNQSKAYGPLHNAFYYAEKLKDQKDRVSAAESGKEETVLTSTDYVKESSWFDRERASSYWTKTEELFARAMESWIADKMADQGKSSDYLTYKKGGVYEIMFKHNPYPTGEERTAINDAFQKLFDVIEEKVEDGKTLLHEPEAEYGVSEPTGTYTTSGGKKITFTQLDLFGEDTTVEAKPAKKTAAKRISTPDQIRLRPLAEGEMCNVERVYEENKYYDFTSKPTVSSPQDVAYIFKSLEDSAVEHAFVVLVKRGKPTVIHMGMGGLTEATVDHRLAMPAIKAMKPDKIYLVHNHPSGSLRPSAPDRKLLMSFRNAFGPKVQDGIIIDTFSGQFVTFDTYNDTNIIDEAERTDAEMPIKAYSMGKQIFKKGWVPQRVSGSNDIAEFISTQRLGVRDKICALILDNNLRVVGNIHLPYTSLLKDCDNIADEAGNVCAQMGGTLVALYGNNISFDGAATIAYRLKRYNIKLVDAISVDSDFDPNDPRSKWVKDYKSAYDEGAMEPEPQYGASKDELYKQAVLNGDLDKAKRMLQQAAKDNGYDSDTDYQGSAAFNGAAPSENGYFATREERIEAFQNGEFEGEQSFGDYVEAGLDGWDLDWQINNPAAASHGNPSTLESIRNLSSVADDGKKTIKMYRAVPSDVKEDSFRNGDWVTPSRKYAEFHITLQDWEGGRIIEQEVPVDHIWWDGNDINEWGYDDGKQYAYQNTKNNKKLLDITYDQKGDLIPLSERFDQNNPDTLHEDEPEYGKHLAGVHNIYADKLRKAMKLGGLANPSTAVIDTNKNDFTSYGEISLVMPSSMVDAKTGRNAGTWTADAWTPVFPQIVKKIPAGGYDLLNEDMEVLDANGSRDIWSRTRNDLSNYLERDNSPYGLGFWYLTEKGLSPEVVRFDSGVSAEDKELYNKLTANDTKRAYELSKDEIKQLLGIYAKSRFNTIKGKPGTADEILALYQELREEWVKDLEDPNVKGFIKRHLRDSIEGVDTYGVPYSILSDFTYSMGNAIRKDGNVDVNATLGRAENKVKEVYDSDFLDWLDGKMQKYGVQEKFYAGMDKNGRAIYKPNTLESVSRYMKSQGRNGALDWSSVGNLIATVASRVRTLKQIRNASGNLVATEQEHKDFKEKWGDILFDIADECYRISSDPNAGFARLAEALREDNPALYLKKEYGVSLSTEARNNLSQFIDEVQNHFPTGYFETKFERPVMLDEFAAAVVPDNVADDIRAGLQDAGLKVITYEHGSEESRKAAMEEAYKEPNVRFRGENKPMFYSNAARAVDIVKQDKATPAQWLAMIQKNGGIKAGEDKWTGLSDWLANNTSKSLTKDEVLEYIRQNQIQVKDVNYSERGVRFKDDGDGTINIYQGKDWYGSIEEDEGRFFVKIGNDSIGEYNSLDEAKATLEEMGIISGDNAIDRTRIGYTTAGLENKREIALVVPGIEPYNINDNIHFGDAGEGRAVAWIRFGEASAQNDADARYEELKKQHEAEKDHEKAKEIAAEMRKLQFSSGRGEGSKVLVIDEIQSKRHQDGREKGYKSETKKHSEAVKEHQEFILSMLEKYGTKKEKESYSEDRTIKGSLMKKLSEEERKEARRLSDAVSQSAREIVNQGGQPYGVPDAPFQKNWHELAMKRMLRYAAENGYDKIAWTTGEQQADRYSLSNLVNAIDVVDAGNGNRSYDMFMTNGTIDGFTMDSDGMIIDTWGNLRRAEGRSVKDVFGKEWAERLMNAKPGETIDAKGEKLGGAGMKGFYDEILPRFMNKYGKKWGVSVNDVTLAIEGSPTMHSVDVTPEMRESVMEGQPLFREGNGQEPADGKMSDIKRETDKLSATFHTPVIFHPTLDDVPERWRAKKGVFVVDSGEIHLIGPNLTGVEDAHTTFIHEVTAHNGLRKMLGDENFNSLCDRVWNEAMSREDRDRYFINAYSKGRTLEDIQREAADEYMANLGESEVKPSLWKRIKAWIKGLFGKMGIKLKMTDEDIQYMLWKSRNRLMEGDNLEATIRKTAADSRKRRSMQERAANAKIKQDWKSLLQSIDLSSHAKNAPEITSGSKPVSGANLGKINNTAKLLDALSNEVSKKPLPKEDFINQIAGALGYNNSSVDISKYPKEEFVIGDGKSVTIRTSNHYANADNYTRTYNINGRDGNYGIVIKYRNARFNPNKNVDYLEFVYYGDRVENNKNLQLFIVDGLKHLIETGSVAKMPEIDRLNPSGRFRELIKSANGGDANIRSRTSEELDRTIPGWNDGSVREDGRDNTQITGTVSTYKKIGKWMQDNGMKDYTILDASSGLGLGTKALREMGFDVEDVEPFPSESREAPTYKSYDDITKKYDMVISNAVLNVIPDDWRNNVLHSMADKVKPGGKLFINVRDAGEIKGVKNKVELDSPHELLITNPDGSPRHYQRFWTKQELIDYVKGELGDGWKVEAATAKNSGVNNGRPVICTKLTGNGGPGERYRSDEPIINEQAIEALQMLYPEKTREQILDEHSELLAEYALTPAEELSSLIEKFGSDERRIFDRAADYLTQANPVSELSGDEFQKEEGNRLTDRVAKLFEEQGGKAKSPFGTVILDRKSAKNSINHGMSRDKAAAFASVKDVIEKGIEILPLRNWRVHGKAEKTGMVAAPITINGERRICVVEVISNKKDKHLYTHEAFVLDDSPLPSAKRIPESGVPSYSGAAHESVANVLKNFLKEEFGKRKPVFIDYKSFNERFSTGRPFKKKGESQREYLNRLREWEETVNRVVDENPDMKSMEQINDEIAALALEKMKADGDTSAIDERMEELRQQLKEHGNNLDKEDKDRVEYLKPEDESLSDEEKAEKFRDNQELNIEKDVDAYTRRIFNEQMKENMVDTSDLGIRRTIKEAIIERRSSLEVSNYDDAVFFKDIESRTTKEQRKALPFILEGYPLDELPDDLKDRLETYSKELPSKREVIALLKIAANDAVEVSLVEGFMKDDFDKLEESLSNEIDSESAALEHGAISDREWFHRQRQEGKFSLDKLNPKTPAGIVIKNKYVGTYTEHPEKLPETTSLLTNAVNKYFSAHLADLKSMDYGDLKNMIMHLKPDTGGVEVTPELKQVAIDIRRWFDVVYEMLKGAGFFDYENGDHHLDNYVTHVWKFDTPDPKLMSKYEERLRTSSPYVKHRTINSLREGIEIGLVPKFDDIIQVMSQYGRYANEATVNRGFINNLLGFTINKMPVLMEKSKAISGYKEMPGATLEKYKVHPSVYRMLQAVFLPKETSDDVNLRGISGMFRVTSAFMKKMALNLSFFHHIALTESIIANTNPVYAMNILFNKVIMETAKTGKLPAYQDESVTRDAVAHLVKLGVTDDYNVNYINSTFEAFAKGLEFIDRKSIGALDKWIVDHPSAKRVPKALINEIFQPVIDFVRGVDVAQQGMDTLLWDMLHDAYKLWTYKYMADEIRGRKLSDKKQEERLLNSAGQWINDSFGGQHWEVIGMSPQFVRFLSKYLLSADWTVSAMFRQSFSMAGFGNLYNVAHPLGVVSDTFHAFANGDSQFDQMRGINRWKQFCEEWKDWVQNAYLTEEAKFRLKKSYRNTLMGWITTFGFYGLVGALARFVDVQTQEKIAEERRAAGDKDYLSPYEILYPHGMKWYDYTFPGNTYGNKTYLFAGRYPDGTERYAREGKQYREIVEMFYGRDGFEVPGAFIDKMVGKLNPMWQLIVETGGGAMNSKFVNREIRDAKPGVERTMAILNNMVEGFVPWSLVGEWNPLNHFMPNVKGMRPYRARTLMEEGLINKDLKLLEDVRRACIMNGLDTETIFKAAKQNVYLEYRKSLMDGVNDLQDALKQFDTEPDLGRKDRLGKYIDKQLGAEMHGQLGQTEFEHMINDALEGNGTSKADDESYLKYQTSEDRAEDIRFKKAMAGLKPIFDEWNSETGETKQSIYNNHKREIDSYNAFKNARGTMNYYKKNLKNGYGDPERAMQRIREERQKALRNAAKLK